MVCTQSTGYVCIYGAFMCALGTPVFKMCQWLLRTDREVRRNRNRAQSLPVPVNESTSTFEQFEDTFQEPTASTPLKLDKDKPLRRRGLRANTLDLESLIKD